MLTTPKTKTPETTPSSLLYPSQKRTTNGTPSLTPLPIYINAPSSGTTKNTQLSSTTKRTTPNASTSKSDTASSTADPTPQTTYLSYPGSTLNSIHASATRGYVSTQYIQTRTRYRVDGITGIHCYVSSGGDSGYRVWSLSWGAR